MKTTNYKTIQKYKIFLHSYFSNKFVFRRENRGYVTITVLILMMVLLAASYFYADALFTELAIARNNKGASVAFSLAEAGVQEAVYRIQYDATARNTFLNTSNGTTAFSHDPALLNNGVYSVTIQNTVKAAATVTSVGTYKIGTLRTARREIKASITQASSPPPYDEDGAMFSNPAGGESTGDIEFDDATITTYGGSIISGRDIKFDDTISTVEGSVKVARNVTNSGSTVNCNCLILDDGDPLTPQCSESPGCTFQTVPAGEMPEINFDGAGNSYKNQAIDLGQYYENQNNFLDLVPAGSTQNFNGVVYIDGSLNLDGNRTIIMNGVLATYGSISIGKNSGGSSANGTITVNNPGGGLPSGVITQHDFIVKNKGSFSGTGLVYAGIKADFNSSTNAIDLTGGILSRRILVKDRTLTVHFNSEVINDTLDQPVETPVIEINHWEEEY